MLRTLPLACLVLLAAGCAASADDSATDAEPRTYAVVTNDDIIAYTIYLNGVRMGRVPGSTTRRIPLVGVPLDGIVTFTAESGTRSEEDAITWSPTMIDLSTDIELRISYRAR